MKKSHVIFTAGAVLVLGILAFIAIKKLQLELEVSKKREDKVDRENKELKNKLSQIEKEVEEILETKDELSDDVKKRLKSLTEMPDIDIKVVNELVSISNLIDIKEETKAVFSLVKIIENLLAKIYKKDKGSDTSTPRLVDLIKYAKKQNLLELDEFHFLNGLREIRNEEAHEVSVKKNYQIVASSILIGISLIHKLSRIIKG